MDWSKFFGKKVVIITTGDGWVGCDILKGYADYNREWLELENGSVVRTDQVGYIRITGEVENRICSTIDLKNGTISRGN